MTGELPRLDVPVTLNDTQFLWLNAVMESARLPLRYTALGPGSKRRAKVDYVVQFHRDHARASCRLFRELMKVPDPSQDTPFTGACPACGTETESAWACPSCGLSFRSGTAADHPLVLFLRAHGGYD
ncbi:MAG: hypothetical protein IT453_11165 [Planctomycetes bacterium]|nr:hypothetical protein [Planctomycetota bacterium]